MPACCYVRAVLTASCLQAAPTDTLTGPQLPVRPSSTAYHSQSTAAQISSSTALTTITSGSRCSSSSNILLMGPVLALLVAKRGQAGSSSLVLVLMCTHVCRIPEKRVLRPPLCHAASSPRSSSSCRKHWLYPRGPHSSRSHRVQGLMPS